MSLNAELACAARAMQAHAGRLPGHLRPDLAALWADLMAEVDATRSAGAAELLVIEWRRDIEAELVTKLVHAPLGAER